MNATYTQAYRAHRAIRARLDKLEKMHPSIYNADRAIEQQLRDDCRASYQRLKQIKADIASVKQA